jgi:hypothetical protein
MKKAWAPVALLCGLIVFPAACAAELVAKGDLFVRFEGGIAPNALPRQSQAPIAVRIGGTVRVPPGGDPPALRRIQVALNREGRLETRGLPVCRRDQLSLASPAEALAACGDALIGGGGFTGTMSVSDQKKTTIPGQILMFNGKIAGKPVALAHVSQTQPFPIDRVVVFKIRHTGGTFGTVISANLPPSLNRNGYLNSIYLQLHRRYVYRGRQLAYLSAGCPAPAGFRQSLFPFARASMSFSDGRTLKATMTRTCRVRGARAAWSVLGP